MRKFSRQIQISKFLQSLIIRVSNSENNECTFALLKIKKV